MSPEEKSSLEWLKSPWLMFISIVAGVLFSIFLPQGVGFVAPFGHLYLLFLQMTVIPIMIAAIVTSIGRVMRSEKDPGLLLRLFLVFISTALAAVLIGAVIGLIARPGSHLPPETEKVLGHMMYAMEDILAHSEFASHEPTEASGLLEFIMESVPQNIFDALSQGLSLQILSFFIVFSLLLKYVDSKPADLIIDFFDGIYQIFEKAIDLAEFFLPIGLFSLIAEHMVHLDTQTLRALGKFILFIYVASILLLILNTILLSVRTKKKWYQVLSALKESIFIAFGSRNNYAAIPSSLDGLINKLKLNTYRTRLAIPFGTTMVRYGDLLLFAFTALFVAQLYGVPTGIGFFLILIPAALLAGLATAGAPGVFALSMVSFVLLPLGLPVSTGLIVLIALDPILDPVLTLVNVNTNCCAAALISKRGKV